MAQLERDVAGRQPLGSRPGDVVRGRRGGEALRLAAAGQEGPRADAHHRPVLALLHQRPVPRPPEERAEPATLARSGARRFALARALSDDGVTVHWTNPVGVLFLEFVARNHKKSVVIDDRIVYLGGINVCDHNFAWHDIMLRIEDERVGAFMRARHRRDAARREPVEPARLRRPRDRAARRRVEPAAERARPAADPRGPRVDRGAERLPDVPVLRLPRRRRRPRGVAVTVVAPKHNNKPRMTVYTEWAAARAGVTRAALRRPHEPHQGDAGGRRGAGRGVVEFRLPEFPHQPGSAGDRPRPRGHRPVQARRAGPGPRAERRRRPARTRTSGRPAGNGRSGAAGRVAVPVSRWLRRRRAARQRAAAAVPARAASGVTESE